MWVQNYNPLDSHFWSTVEAALPVVILLGYIASNLFKPHHAALVALLIALLIATMIFEMPVQLALLSSGFGVISGFVSIGWIVLNVLFLYRLTVSSGRAAQLQNLVGHITQDRRLQILLIAFAFGSFFEGTTGFGTPVAITGAILIGLGFSPLAASVLSLIANTTAVGYAAFGAPILALQTSMGVDAFTMGAMVGRQLSIFGVIIPFWLMFVFAGWRGMMGVFPAILVTGISFGLTQFLVSNYLNYWAVDMVASLVSMTCLILLTRVWQPAQIWHSTHLRHNDPYTKKEEDVDINTSRLNFGKIWFALMPWVVMSLALLMWNSSWFKVAVNNFTAIKFTIHGLDKMVVKMPPSVEVPTPETVVFNFTWLTYPGTGILIAAILIGLMTGFSGSTLYQEYRSTVKHIGTSVLTIMIMFAIGTLTRFAGIDTTLGLAFVSAGVMYPFFGTYLGWLGVALTGSDTASNLLLGNIQKVTSQELGFSPYLMGAAHASGGVMGKMVDAQNIVTAATVTGYQEKAGLILRFLFLHALLLGGLMGLWVLMQAYLMPWMIVTPPAS